MTEIMPKPRVGMTRDQFRALLKRLGMTQVEAAKRLDRSFSTVNAWWNGRTTITDASASLIRERLPEARRSS